MDDVGCVGVSHTLVGLRVETFGAMVGFIKL